MPAEPLVLGQPEVLFRDQHLIAINKPSGLLVHRSPVDSRERQFAVQWLRDFIGQRVHPVHRLDKPTSGVLLFALDADAARCLMHQFQQGQVGKRYLAVVRGWPDDDGVIDRPIRERPDARIGVDANAPQQPARSRYRCLGRVEWPDPVDRYPTTRYGLVDIAPETGRRHQIRRHLKGIGHPIIGDTTYGKSVHNRYFQARFDCHRLLLHARSLTCQHPQDGSTLDLLADLDNAFRCVMSEAKWTLED